MQIVTDEEAEPAGITPVRRGIVLAFAATALVVGEFIWLTIASAKVIDRGGDPWQTGDWLIDLSAGPVRRGLLGELFFRVIDSPNVLWLVFAVQIALLGSLCALTLVLFWHSPRTAPWLMLVCSPAFLLFAPLSPEGALRKELFGLVAFALLAVAVRFRWRARSLVGVVVLFALGSIAHELTAFMLPAFVVLVLWGHRDGLWGRRTAHVAVGVIAGVALAAVVWALAFPATSADTITICASWVRSGLDRGLCTGALRFHSRSLSDSLELTKGMFPGYLSLVPLVVLSVVPFVALGVPRRIWRLLAVTFVGLLPLFLAGIDYGRWIYVAIALVSLTCLATWPRGDVIAKRVPVWTAIAFVALWSLPYAGPQTSHSLFVQLLSRPVRSLMGTPAGGPDFGP